MRRVVRKLALFGAFAAPCALHAGQQWLFLTSPHFELFTTAGESQGREALLHFERARRFFAQASPVPPPKDERVRITAFRSEAEYRPYRMNDSALAYYSRHGEHDTIVMQDPSPEHFGVATHEYTHLVMAHSGLKVPVWFNEGWAELNSTLKAQGKRAVVGEMIPGRVQLLFRGPLIPLRVLTAVDQNSPLYNERSKAGMFYSESWALVHMLFLAPEYRAQFSEVVKALAHGELFASASSKLLGKSIDEVENDLDRYLGRRQLFAAAFNIPLRGEEREEIAVTKPERFDVDLMLADLLAVTGQNDAARKEFERLAGDQPERAEPDIAMAILALASRDRATAKRHFAAAVKKGTKDEYLHLRYGTMLVEDEHYEEALAMLKAVRKVKEADASTLFSAKAYAEARLGETKNANADLEQARKWARSEIDRKRVEQIERMLAAN